MSGSYAHRVAPEEVPVGMMHVGWRCASTGHDCLLPRSRELTGADPEWIPLYDANHHAYWVPVYARKEDLEP